MTKPEINGKYAQMKILFIIAGFIFFPLISFGQHFEYSVSPTFDQHNDIRHYLSARASHITHRSLMGVEDLSDWKSTIEKRRMQLIEMLGLQDWPLTEDRKPPKATLTGVIEEEGFRIEKLYYESAPNLYVPANLYLPTDVEGPAPAILYVCGHSHAQKYNYQAHARSFAQHGFVVLLIETIQRGEVEGKHLGAESLGCFHWYSRGYHPGGVEVWNGIRGIDLLCQRPEVDQEKIGVTGISGGGSQSWYLGAIDVRIMATAAVAGAASLEGQIGQRTIDDHCDCMMPINTYGIDFSDIGALIAPRAFLIAQTTGDIYYSIEAVRALHTKIKPIYSLYRKPEKLTMIEATGGHSYGEHEEFRNEILAFFLHELTTRKVESDQLPTMNISKTLTEEELRVYVDGVPENDLTKVIQDSFITLAKIPEIHTFDQLAAYRNKVKAFLDVKTFGAFPLEESPLDIRMEFQALDGADLGRQDYSFVSEEGWRLSLSIRRRRSAAQPSAVVLVLKNSNEARWDSYGLVSGLRDKTNIAFFEARGIGSTGWDPSLQWHIRRAAAWTGQTVASMRVYDVIRCVAALRKMAGIDPDNIHIAAQGEMVAVASYAALLDGGIKSLILKNPPPTQNEASQPDGKGPAIEMLNCLRVTDLPQVVGMMFPRDVIFIGPTSETYRWSEKLYQTLGKPEAYQKVEDLSGWKVK